VQSSPHIADTPQGGTEHPPVNELQPGPDSIAQGVSVVHTRHAVQRGSSVPSQS